MFTLPWRLLHMFKLIRPFKPDVPFAFSSHHNSSLCLKRTGSWGLWRPNIAKFKSNQTYFAWAWNKKAWLSARPLNGRLLSSSECHVLIRDFVIQYPSCQASGSHSIEHLILCRFRLHGSVIWQLCSLVLWSASWKQLSVFVLSHVT